MILIISNKGDIHCNPVVKILTKKKYPFFRLNTEELTNDYQISFFYKKNKEFLILKNLKNGKILDSSQVTAIWDRRPLSQEIKLPRNKNIRKVISDETTMFLEGIKIKWDISQTCGEDSTGSTPGKVTVEFMPFKHTSTIFLDQFLYRNSCRSKMDSRFFDPTAHRKGP